MTRRRWQRRPRGRSAAADQRRRPFERAPAIHGCTTPTSPETSGRCFVSTHHASSGNLGAIEDRHTLGRSTMNIQCAESITRTARTAIVSRDRGRISFISPRFGICSHRNSVEFRCVPAVICLVLGCLIQATARAEDRPRAAEAVGKVLRSAVEKGVVAGGVVHVSQAGRPLERLVLRREGKSLGLRRREERAVADRCGDR